MFQPFKHQREFADFWYEKGRVLNLSGCGTGKTGAVIHFVKTYFPGARVLVLGPLSILRPAWGGDLDSFWPQTTWDIAYAKNRAKVFEGNSQWVITNHDAIKPIEKEGWHHQFDILVVDEADGFRNKDSQRSKAMNKVCKEMPLVTLMTGTPTPKSVTDIWHLACCIDGGERLGRNYFGFRSQVCTPRQVAKNANAIQWEDKPGAQDMVTSLLSDVVYRVSLDEVTELPDIIYRSVKVDLPRRLRAQYMNMLHESVVALDSGRVVNAVHAGARVQKLLQICSGAIYDEQGVYHDIHTERHALALDLVEETDASIVAFQWQHQKEGLIKEAKKRKINYAVIDGSVSATKREQIVADYQAGKLQVVFAHPQSAGHGITLTRGNRVIWASPTYRPDLYQQFNHRIYRTGQKRKCEIIHIAAADTAEEQVYESMLYKEANMMSLLGMLVQLNKAA